LLHRAFAGTVTRLLSAHEPRRLSILNFHRVLAEPNPVTPDVPDAVQFEALMARVCDWFNPLPLSQALQRLCADTLPPRALCVTFDDGYADNLEVALPVLQGLEMSATVFVATGLLDGGIMWNDRILEAVGRCPADTLDLRDFGLGVQTLPALAERGRFAWNLIEKIKFRPQTEREQLARELSARYAPDLTSPMLTREQLRELHAAGVEIGGHTVSHPILANIDEAKAREEIATNKEELEGLLGERLQVFAYPNGKAGDFGPAHARMVRELGYAAAVTTLPGVATATTDPYALPRFSPWDRTPTRFGLRLLHNMVRTL
jgi:peptidoglycan/xylan/chitin deacetylase (PgdA/CDA1 family)